MATLKLPVTRFICQHSIGCSRSKYAYLAMQKDLEEALKSCAWRESVAPATTVTLTVNQLTKTDAPKDADGRVIGQSSYTAYLDDKYDAYKQAGDAIAQDATMCAYAGMVAYRFKLPDTYLSSQGVLDTVKLTFSRDRYCRKGLRVVAIMTNEEMPSNNWDVVRGDGAALKVERGLMSQESCPYLLAGRADETEISFSASAATKCKYLFVYLTLEDYNDFWEDYNAKEKRQYYIEGSAMMISSKASFEFLGAITADVDNGIEVPPLNSQVSTNPLGFTVNSSPSYEAGNCHVFGDMNSCTNLFMLILPNNGFSHALDGSDDLTADQKQRLYYRETANRMLNLVRGGPYAFKHTHAALGYTCMGGEGYNYQNDYSLSEDICKVASLPPSSLDGDYENLEESKRLAHDKFTGRYPGYYPFGVWFAMAHKRYSMSADGEVGEVEPGCIDQALNKHMLAMSYMAYLVPHDASVSKKTRLVFDCGALFDGASIEISVLCWKMRRGDACGPFGRTAITALAAQSAFWTGSEKHISGGYTSEREDTPRSVTMEADLIGECSAKQLTSTGNRWKNQATFEIAPGMINGGDVVILAPKIIRFKENFEADFIAGPQNGTRLVSLKAGMLNPYGMPDCPENYFSSEHGFGTLYGQLTATNAHQLRLI